MWWYSYTLELLLELFHVGEIIFSSWYLIRNNSLCQSPDLNFNPLPLCVEWTWDLLLVNRIWQRWPHGPHGPQPCLTQWNYEPCRVGPPKTDGSWWRVLTKRGPLEKEITNHFSILALRTSWTVWKGKKLQHWKWTPQVSRCLICYWRSVEI